MKKSKAMGRSKWAMLVGAGVVVLALATTVVAQGGGPPLPVAEFYGSFIAVSQPTTFQYNLNDPDKPGVWDTIGSATEYAFTSNTLRQTSDITVQGSGAMWMFEGKRDPDAPPGAGYGGCAATLFASDGGNPDGVDDYGDPFGATAQGIVYW